ncbi:MAG: GAF domain-containing protein, partial [Chloroflexota bacterium]|nr:GAF domain-containing protein [Chloroflexota bacterium]
MKEQDKTKEQLIDELAEMRQRVAELEASETERRRAEEALRESEERFQQVAENAQEWIWEVDTHGLYTYASPIVEEIFGYKPEEVVGEKHFYDLFHPEDREELKKAAFEAFAQKQPFRRFINRNVRKDGETVWLSTSGVPILGEKGNLLGYRGADINITERKRAEENIERRAAQLATLHQASTAVASRLTLDEIFDTVVQGLSEAFGYRLIGIYLIEEGVLELKAHVGYGSPPDPAVAQMPLEKGIVGRTARTGQPQLVTNVEEAPDFFYGAPGITSEACVPLRRGDEVLGVLNVESNRVDKHLDASDLQLLTLLSNHIVIAIENARLFEEERRRATQLALINEVGEKAASILDLDRLMQEVPRSVQEKFDYYNVSLFLLDEERREVVMQAVAGGFEHIAPGQYRQSLDEGIIGFVARTGKSWLANDVSKDPHYVK